MLLLWISILIVCIANVHCFRHQSLTTCPQQNKLIQHGNSFSKTKFEGYRKQISLQSFSRLSSRITSANQYIQYSSEGKKPESVAKFAFTNFKRDLKDILEEIKLHTFGNKNQDDELPQSLGLTLSNEAVKRTEELRVKNGGRVDAHPVAITLYEIGCKMLDIFYDKRPLERFWFLETIARIPYFVYVSALHLYESLGWWREPSLRKIHSAEEWNEMHHLLIMEALGANKRWIDRFLAYNAVIGYYWMLVIVYMLSPRIAYQFMELLEAHAVDTYATFIEENAEKLKALPAPDVAVKYYTGKDLYNFDEFQVSREVGTRRPTCNNLYETFCNIRDDEIEHVHTMQACQNYALTGVAIQSPHEKVDNLWVL